MTTRPRSPRRNGEDELSRRRGDVVSTSPPPQWSRASKRELGLTTKATTTPAVGAAKTVKHYNPAKLKLQIENPHTPHRGSFFAKLPPPPKSPTEEVADSNTQTRRTPRWAASNSARRPTIWLPSNPIKETLGTPSLHRLFQVLDSLCDDAQTVEVAEHVVASRGERHPSQSGVGAHGHTRAMTVQVVRPRGASSEHHSRTVSDEPLHYSDLGASITSAESKKKREMKRAQKLVEQHSSTIVQDFAWFLEEVRKLLHEREVTWNQLFHARAYVTSDILTDAQVGTMIMLIETFTRYSSSEARARFHRLTASLRAFLESHRTDASGCIVGKRPSPRVVQKLNIQFPSTGGSSRNATPSVGGGRGDPQRVFGDQTNGESLSRSESPQKRRSKRSSSNDSSSGKLTRATSFNRSRRHSSVRLRQASPTPHRKSKGSPSSSPRSSQSTPTESASRPRRADSDSTLSLPKHTLEGDSSERTHRRLSIQPRANDENGASLRPNVLDEDDAIVELVSMWASMEPAQMAQAVRDFVGGVDQATNVIKPGDIVLAFVPASILGQASKSVLPSSPTSPTTSLRRSTVSVRHRRRTRRTASVLGAGSTSSSSGHGQTLTAQESSALMYVRLIERRANGNYNVYVDHLETRDSIVEVPRVYALPTSVHQLVQTVDGAETAVSTPATKFTLRLLNELRSRTHQFLVDRGVDMETLGMYHEGELTVFDVERVEKLIGQVRDCISDPEFAFMVRDADLYADAKVEQFFEGLDENDVFLPTRNRLLNAVLTFPFVTFVKARCQRYVQDTYGGRRAVEKHIRELFSGERKNKLSKWWLTTISTRCNAFLESHGFDIHAVNDNYIEEPPDRIEDVRNNETLLLRVLDPSEEHLGTRALIQSVKSTVYPVIEEFLLHLKSAVLRTLGEPTLCSSPKALKLMSFEELIEVYEDKKQHVKDELATEVRNAVLDMEYLYKMIHLEEHQPPPGERVLDVVPISGLVVGLFRRYENEHRTVLELWDRTASTMTTMSPTTATATSSSSFAATPSSMSLVNSDTTESFRTDTVSRSPRSRSPEAHDYSTKHPGEGSPELAARVRSASVVRKREGSNVSLDLRRTMSPPGRLENVPGDKLSSLRRQRSPSPGSPQRSTAAISPTLTDAEANTPASKWSRSDRGRSRRLSVGLPVNGQVKPS